MCATRVRPCVQARASHLWFGCYFVWLAARASAKLPLGGKNGLRQAMDEPRPIGGMPASFLPGR